MANGDSHNGRKLPHERVPPTVRSEQERQSSSEETVRRTGKPPSREIRSALLGIGIPAVVGLLAVVALVMWLGRDRQPVDIQERAPTVAERPSSQPQESAEQGAAPAAGAAEGPSGADQPSESSSATPPPAPPPTTNTVASSTPAQSTGRATSNLPGAWPRFRGPNIDNISPERVGLARSWGSGGPKKLWSVSLGQGFAGPAVLSGRVYILDYDENAKADVLRCLSLADGKQIWAQAYKVAIKANHGISRTVPAVTDKYVVTIGPKCHVLCCSTAGKTLWGIDLVKDYGTKVPPWYAGQCPLIDNGKAIIAPGGSALMIAVDCATGSVVWKTPNPRGWQMTHASIIPMKLGGQRVYVYPASGGVVGVSPSDGHLLWEFSGWHVKTAEVPSPLPIGDGRIFLCGGYGAGSMMIKASGNRVSKVFTLPQNVFGSHQQTPILYKGHIYGVGMDKQLVCLDLNGKRVWSSGHTTRFGIGPYMIAEGMIYLLDDGGTLTLAEATSTGYKQLAQAKVLDGPDAWGPMALAGGRLLCRDMHTMVCLDVKGG